MTSTIFLFTFLPITLILYYLVPRKAKNLVLLLCSLVFYAWGEPVYIVLMIASIVFNYFSGLDLGHKKGRTKARRKRLIITIVVNLAVLGFFKYYSIVLANLNAVLPFDIPYKELALPIGLSFYTLRILSYMIDLYREEVSVQTNLVSFGVYVSMFPQLIAGPIMRYADMEKQLKTREETLSKCGQGAEFFLRGLAKKVLLANTIGMIYTKVSGLSEMSVLTAWIGCLAYAFQIYFAFSGYSDMAIGLGKMFGFEFMKNFDYPYISKSVTEFWRRWHISLINWFHTYVSIPLGSDKVSVSRHIMNLLLVWFLIGVWHGAGWNFILWGIYYGIILVVEKYLTGRWLKKLPGAVQILYNMLLVMIGWVFFASPDVGHALKYLGAMFGVGAAGFADRQALYLVKTNWLLWIAAIAGSTPLVHRIYFSLTHNEKNPAPVINAVVYAGMFLLCIAYMVTEGGASLLIF